MNGSDLSGKGTQPHRAGVGRQGAATWQASGKARRLGREQRREVQKQSLDAVVVGALLLLGTGATFLVGENLNRTQKTQLSSGAIGAAIGLLAGYSVGKLRP